MKMNLCLFSEQVIDSWQNRIYQTYQIEQLFDIEINYKIVKSKFINRLT